MPADPAAVPPPAWAVEMANTVGDCGSHHDSDGACCVEIVNRIARLLASVREGETASKDRAYTERNRLVALIASLYPSSLERHDDADKSWEDDWRWIVFIDLPTGQASWHIHDSHLPMFDHVPRFAGRKWDGHTTEEKYARISLLHTPPSGGGGA